MRRLMFGLACAVILFLYFLVPTTAWAIWHFPDRIADDKPVPLSPRDVVPLVVAVVGVVTVEAVSARQVLEGRQSRMRWSQAYVLSGASVALMIVVGEYLVPPLMVVIGRFAATALVNLIVQIIAFRALAPAFTTTDVGTSALAKTVLAPSVLAALFPVVLPGLYH